MDISKKGMFKIFMMIRKHNLGLLAEFPQLLNLSEVNDLQHQSVQYFPRNVVKVMFMLRLDIENKEIESAAVKCFEL